MRNSKMHSTVFVTALLFSSAFALEVGAQEQAKGFALNRLYLSAPGGGWFVMDDLSMDGKLGGTVSFTFDHAHNPLVVRSADGTRSVSVVSEEQIADVGLSVTSGPFRVYVNLSGPTYMRGNSDVIDGRSFAGPRVDLGTEPDTITDMRFGMDARLIGESKSAFSLGVGAQVFVPSGNQSDYVSDGKYRAMLRLLAAGEASGFVYSGQTGVHLRKAQDDTPGDPVGSEYLFGLAGGKRFSLSPSTLMTIGPEIYGATAIHSFLKPEATDLEWLLTSRITTVENIDRQWTVRLGAGSGFAPRFGAPELRAVLGIELSGSAN